MAVAVAVGCTTVRPGPLPPPPPSGPSSTTSSIPATTTSTGASSSTTTTAAAGCPSAAFADLSSMPGAGSGYARPSLGVRCTATELVVTSNGMPSYAFTPMTPNPLKTQSWTWHVPLRPTPAASTTSIVNRLGTIGFTVTGLPIYGPTEGGQPASEAYGDPVANGILDTCGGHTGPAGEYHDHALRDTSACGLGASPILGYAIDGFPIYGSRGCLDVACTQVVTFTSGYVRTGDPTTQAWSAHEYRSSSDPTVLDACNGRVGPDGTYRYHATSTFPYTIGCFRGTPTTQSGAAGGPMPPMG
ncbi:MAG: YHYH protein [Acidimicrobiales bacterium]